MAVVGQQHDQVVGTVPGWGNQPEGGAAGAGIVQDSLLDWWVGGQGENGLGQDGALLLRPGQDAHDLLGLIQPKLLFGDLVFEETALGALGFFRVAEQHHQMAGGHEVPRAQASFDWLLERPVV
jgi:hypothetical protein